MPESLHAPEYTTILTLHVPEAAAEIATAIDTLPREPHVICFEMNNTSAEWRHPIEIGLTAQLNPATSPHHRQLHRADTAQVLSEDYIQAVVDRLEPRPADVRLVGADRNDATVQAMAAYNAEVRAGELVRYIAGMGSTQMEARAFFERQLELLAHAHRLHSAMVARKLGRIAANLGRQIDESPRILMIAGALHDDIPDVLRPHAARSEAVVLHDMDGYEHRVLRRLRQDPDAYIPNTTLNRIAVSRALLIASTLESPEAPNAHATSRRESQLADNVVAAMTDEDVARVLRRLDRHNRHAPARRPLEQDPITVQAGFQAFRSIMKHVIATYGQEET